MNKFELAQISCKPGGWAGNRIPSNEEISEAEGRWINRSYRPEVIDEDNCIENQCGGCNFFAAVGSDFGLCWNKQSPLDGQVTFEHGGCLFHSALKLHESTNEI